ncbi:DEAD/DEAH box helicase [Methanocella conradii]|uniref:DEAD/DEAH box helicase n=1 Tax=Methanocella conradii TaxID=1175444 RepID=UPI00157D98AA|nr:DEAD/DEAH box helicase [Methanocella conradii]
MKDCFEMLDPRIRSALASMGFSRPTETQEKAIPAIMSGDNVLVIAPTGTGKTEAAMLPALHGVINGEKRKGFKVIYVTPLRALNRDMLKRLTQWSKELGVSIEVRHGDTPQHERRKQALSPPDVLITTPETLQAIFLGPRMRHHLKAVRYVIVDEVHELASSKRGSQLTIALERLARYADFQRIGLSATVGCPEEVASFLGGVGRRVRIVEVSIEKALDFHVTIPQVCDEDKRLAKKLLTDPDIAAQIREMVRLIHENRSTLMFVNTRQSAEAIGARFRRLGEGIAVHHGSLSKEARIEAEDAFKDGRVPALVCTSSMELGIDIGDISHVIQYMSPREVCRLVQRVGRAGHRVGETSKGTVIAINEDDASEAWAIARRAMAGEIEGVSLHDKPYDALANQVCAIAIEYGEVSADSIFELAKKAYPYRGLSRIEFDLVLKQLAEERVIFVSEAGVISKRGKTRPYMYENLSMIPDEKRYDIQDVISGRMVGTLDEAFVINTEVGAVFITKGDMWRIVEITEDRVRVEPVENPQAEVPSWTGEEIPVPFEVAMEVGAIRRIVEETKGGSAVSLIMARYPTDEHTAKKFVDYVRRQLDEGCPVPTDRRVVVEEAERTIVINACFGHKVNETLGRVVTALLASRLGGGVAMEIDPYRIKLELPKRVRAADIVKLISDLDPAFVEPIIEKTLKNTMLLKWKMVHVARKFGALSRDVDYERISMGKLLKVFEGTPMYGEAVREIFHDKLDVENAKKALKMIRSGEISIVAGRLSLIGGSGFTGGRELMAPETADRSILMALKDRIMNDHVLLFCLNCKRYSAKKRVEDVEDPPVCPVCGSRFIAALKPWEREDMEMARHPEKLKTEDEKLKVKRVYRNGNIVLSHGKKAVIALASRGLGPESASRVIAKLKEDEDDFYRDILRAEREYVRTRRFWV